MFSREESVVEGSTVCSSSFEEELVSLLLDMQDPRRAKEEGRRGVTREPVSYEDSPTTRKRKAASESDDSFDETEEEEESVKPEWKREEDFMAEDDEDWLDSQASTVGLSTNEKVPRKKAPSGSACDKHKRWKKRCPDDCPMRKTKSLTKKRPDDAMDSDSSICSPSPPLSRRQNKGTILQVEAESISQLFRSPFCPEPVSPSEAISKFSAPGNVAFKARQAQFSSGDDLSPQEEDGYVKEEDSFASSPETKSNRGNAKPKKTKASKHRSSRKYLPQACDRHKTLHAKCPANCPDRLKRDSEIAKQQTLHRTSSTELNVPPMVQ